MEDLNRQPPQQVSQPVEQLPTPTKSRTIKFILIFILVSSLLAFGVGGYFLGQKEKAKTGIACTQDAKICPDGSSVGRTGPNCSFSPCSAKPSTDPTANWKTYTNTKYGFSIKYPPNLEGSDKKGNDNFNNFNVICDSPCGVSFPSLYVSVMTGQTYNGMSTELINSFSNLEILGSIETRKSPYPENYWTFKRIPNLQVANQNALTVENDNVWEGEKGMKDIRVFIKNNGIYFELGTYYKTSEELIRFKTFLSTFKFL